MPEIEPENPRSEAKLKQRVEELEKAVTALLKGMRDAEKELDEPLMPEGVYFGITFKD